MRPLFTLLMSILCLSTYGRELFPHEKQFYDKKLEDRKIFLLKEFRANRLTPKTISTLQESFKIAEKEENAMYYNHFSSLLIQQYQAQENYKAIIDLYDRNLKNPHLEDVVSYIRLQSSFYHFFYNYSIDYECDNILIHLKDLVKKLEGYEEIYAQNMIKEIDGLKIKGKTINVKRDQVIETIHTIEKLARFFDKDDLESSLSNCYNYLAITYLEDPNHINHAILLLKKAIRYNNNRDVKLNIILYNNISYAYNLLNDHANSLFYLEKTIPFLEETNDKFSMGYRTYCNLADSYKLANDEVNSQKYEKICLESANQYTLKKSEIDNEIKNYISSNERKIKKSLIDGASIPFIGGTLMLLICIIIPTLWYYKSRQKVAL